MLCYKPSTTFSFQSIVVPPQVEVTPSQIAVNQGTSLSLFCVATPLLPVKWSKMNGSIPGESETDKGKLIVKNVSVEHAGKYRCQATNAAVYCLISCV